MFQNETILKIAYLGFGNSVCRYHLPYVKNKKNIEVKMIYRREEDRVTQSERDRELLYPSIQFTTNFEDVLENQDIDLVVVCTPNSTHVSYAEMILNYGKHALVEKPLAMNSTDAKYIFDLAKSKNLILMTNQNRRYDGDFLALKSVIQSQKCGEVVEVESHYDYYRKNTKHFIGYLENLGVHTIDQMISLFGIPDRVVYDVRSIHHPHECDDYFDLDLFYGNMKVIVKTCYSIKQKYPKFILHGRSGSFILPDFENHNSDDKESKEPYSIPLHKNNEKNMGQLIYVDDNNDQNVCESIEILETDYGKLYDALFDSIINGKEKTIKDEETIAVLEIIEQALKERQ